MLVLGAAVACLIVGCLAPLVVLGPREAGRDVPTLSVISRALHSGGPLEVQVYDTFYSVGAGSTWTARGILFLALVAVVVAAGRHRRLVWAACALLAVAVGGLFVEIGRFRVLQADGASSGWTAYPPLSVSEPATVSANVWWAWAPLVVGILLLALSSLLAPDPESARE